MLRITKESILCEHYVDEQIEIHDIIENGCFSNHLNDTIFVEEDVTLKNVLEHLEKRSEDVETIFGAALGGVPLEPFLDEMRFGTKSQKNLKNLVFGRTCEIVEYSDGSTELLENIEIFSTGVGEKGENKEYMLEFSPISFYTDVPIVVDDTYQILQYIPTSTFIKEVDGSLKRIYDKKSVLKTTKTYTMYELLYALLYEISKYGTPEEREETRKNLYGDTTEPEKNETVSESGVLNRIKELERLEKEAVESEEYEKSAKYRDKISDLKEKLKRTDNESSSNS